MSDSFDEDAAFGEGAVDIEAEVQCPYCGEIVIIALDPGDGDISEYVEDCEVCCRPWQVRLEYDDDGTAEVIVTRLDD